MLWADFSPKPLEGESGNGLHINISLESDGGIDRTPAFMAGIMAHIRELTAFLNPTEESYKRLVETGEITPEWEEIITSKTA